MTHSRNIILVEDDQSMTDAIGRLLRVGGIPHLSFNSAEALLESGAAASAACFVLDVDLPGLSGLELQQRLLETGIRKPVIVISAHDEPPVREAVEASGAEAFLLKPFSGRRLLGAIGRALAQSGCGLVRNQESPGASPDPNEPGDGHSAHGNTIEN